MITHLQDDYIHHFGLTGTNYQVLHSVLNGHLSLYDPNSCDPCISSNKQQCDNASFRQIFILETNENVTCVNIEAFLNQFSGKKAGVRRKCDMLLYGGNKISFLEMFCGEEKFLYPHITTHKDESVDQKIGKLATVRQQITSTIDKLCEVPSIEEAIQSFQKKEGIFGYRRKNANSFNPQQETPEESNMSIFVKTAEVSSDDLHSNLTHGFIFKTVMYPEVYVW